MSTEGETVETPETGEQLPKDHPVLKALEAEREENRRLKAQKSFLEVSAKHPNLKLAPEDFEGRTPDQYETYAASLAERFGQTAPQTTTETPPATEPPKPEVETFIKMARTQGEGAPPKDAEKITRKELEALRAAGKISLADARELIRQGKVVFSNIQPPQAPW